jgi:hypothetical protein
MATWSTGIISRNGIIWVISGNWLKWLPGTSYQNSRIFSQPAAE